MKKSRTKRNKKRTRYNYLGMLGIGMIVLVLLGGLMLESRTLESRLLVYTTRAAALGQSIEDQKERTKEIDELKKYMQTDEYAEEVARSKLGLVKENEIVFREEK